MVLAKSDYDAAYFGDIEESGGLRHDAGYSNYLEIVKEAGYQKRSDYVLSKVSGRILELACGVGTYVRLAKQRGLDWVAVDASDWCKRHEEAPLIEQDALTYLQSQSDNSFDWIVSFAFLECLSPSQLLQYYKETKRVGKNQIHSVYKSPNPKYYESRDISQLKQILTENNIEVRFLVG